jgi:hypothetical protein
MVSEVCLNGVSSRGQNLQAIEDGSAQVTAWVSFLWVLFFSLPSQYKEKKST